MKPKILIVDDEEIVRDFISEVLIRMGYAPLTADCGKRALEYLQAGEFDIVITDFKMPGINGIEVLRQVKKPQILGAPA